MANNYYNFTTGPFIPGTKARSDQVNTEYQAVASAFDLLPTVNDALVRGTPTFAGSTGGTGNAYTVTMPNTRASYVNGDEVVFIANRNNTSACTLQVDSLGATSLVRGDGTALVAGDLVAGLIYAARYDSAGVRFLMTTPNTSFLTDVEAAAAAAAVSETNAATSETNSAASATEAYHWAQYPEDSLVPEGDLSTEYSAYHWSKKAAAWAASVNHPSIVGSGGYFVRVNLAETSLEYHDLFGSYNTWIANQTFQQAGGQTLLTIKPGWAPADSALNGNIFYNYAGDYRSFAGAIPGDTGSYFTVWTWDDTLGTPAWNPVINCKPDSKNLTLGSTELTWEAQIVPTLTRNNTWTGTVTFSGSSFTVTPDAYFTGVLFNSRTNPSFGLLDSGTTNKNYSLDVISGAFSLRSRSDVYGDQGALITVTDTAKTLALTSTSLTFNSLNVPVMDSNAAFNNVGDMYLSEVASDYSYTGTTTSSAVTVTEFALTNVPVGRYKIEFDLFLYKSHTHAYITADATFSGLTVLGDGSGAIGSSYWGQNDSSSPTTQPGGLPSGTTDFHTPWCMYLDVTSGTNSYQVRLYHGRNFGTNATSALRAKSIMKVTRMN